MLEEIRKIAKDYTTENLELNTDLRNDLGLTSFDLVSIIGEIEDKFQIQISEEDIANILTVEDLINYIEEKRK